MVDTIRTETDLLDVFKDAQLAGSITAQDVRDLIVSMRHIHNMGWEFCIDGGATFASQTAVVANDRHLYTNDGGLFPQRHPADCPTVWSITNKPYKGSHFAVFPPDLIEPCIKAGSQKNDIILDPFMGSGTTAMVALCCRWACRAFDRHIRLGNR